MAIQTDKELEGSGLEERSRFVSGELLRAELCMKPGHSLDTKG